MEQPPTAPPTPPLTVTVYVRLGDHDENERRITFKIPDGLDPMELLGHGFAIDGNQAVASVNWVRGLGVGQPTFAGPFGSSGYSLPEALADAQRFLVNYLRLRGFEPQFA